jgi:hypothetical protein
MQYLMPRHPSNAISRVGSALLIIYLIIGCRPENASDKVQDSIANIQRDTATETGQSEDNTTPENFIVDDGENVEFVNEEIGSDPFTKDFRSILASIGKYEVDKKPVRNLHDSTQTDTLFTVKFGKSVMEYYQVRSNDNGLLIMADIQSDKVDFKKGIKIGMSATEFSSLFGELNDRRNLSSVTISTLEGLTKVDFLFSNDTLTSVNLQSYFD